MGKGVCEVNAHSEGHDQTVYASTKMTICMKCQNLFLGKSRKKKNSKCCLRKISPRILDVKRVRNRYSWKKTRFSDLSVGDQMTRRVDCLLPLGAPITAADEFFHFLFFFFILHRK